MLRILYTKLRQASLLTHQKMAGQVQRTNKHKPGVSTCTTPEQQSAQLRACNDPTNYSMAMVFHSVSQDLTSTKDIEGL